MLKAAGIQNEKVSLSPQAMDKFRTGSQENQARARQNAHLALFPADKTPNGNHKYRADGPDRCGNHRHERHRRGRSPVPRLRFGFLPDFGKEPLDRLAPLSSIRP